MQLLKPKDLAIVILAAGKGTRMKSPQIPKVMYEIDGKPMIDKVVFVSQFLQPSRLIIIVGWQGESIINYFVGREKIEFVYQQPQLGTGHAVMQTRKQLADFEGDILVLSGDVPLLTVQTLKNLISLHRNMNSYATILTAEVDNPFGYGRIIRGKDGNVVRIVEQKDAKIEELKSNEINSGIYLFDKVKLFEALEDLKPNNAQGEYYLTDVFEFFWKKNWKVSALMASDSFEVLGINDLEQLEKARRIFNNRKY